MTDKQPWTKPDVSTTDKPGAEPKPPPPPEPEPKEGEK